MSDAFVRGGSGDIRLDQIPAAQGKAFWRQHEQMLAADLYEAEHPGVTVRRPWESDQEHAKRKEDRKPIAFAEPELSVPPHTALRELRLARLELEGLPLDHPKYDEMFTAKVRNIHLLEDVLGQTRTRFEKGKAPKKAEAAPVSADLVEKLAAYKAVASKDKRLAAIGKSQNLELLVLIRGIETDQELQEAIVKRIGELTMAKRETVVV